MSLTNPLFQHPVLHFISGVWHKVLAHGEDLKVISATLAILGLGLKGFSFFRAKLSAFSTRRALVVHLSSQAYTKQEINRAMSYYIVPDCQNIDPGGAEDWRYNLPIRENAFKALDHILIKRTESRHSLILADSGMGKTSLLLNYAARHWSSKRRRSEFNLALIPLGQRNVEEQIKRIPFPKSTVLLLDALDEDPKAIENYRSRLNELLQATSDFRHILITSRTQFFPKDEEIPSQTGLLRFGITAAGESKEYFFNKMYLSPFSDDQVESFIRRRFRWWRPKTRESAWVLVAQIRDLTVRPMILAHIPDLLELTKESGGSFFDERKKGLLSAQIYQELVSAWLKREQPLVKNVTALEEFSRRLAINIIANWQKRGGAKVTSEELDEILTSYQGADPKTAQLVKHSLEKWQVQGRSLLNRDASGNWKFAHRSILEYLAAISIMKGDTSVPTFFLTDQINKFIGELTWIRSGEEMKEIPLVPLVCLRKDGVIFESVEKLRGELVNPSETSDKGSGPVSFEEAGPGLFGIYLLEIVRRATTRSLTKDQIDALTLQVFKRAFPDGVYVGSAAIPSPRLTITDIVTATRWFISINFYVNGVSYFQEAIPNEHQRRPTLEEARSFGKLLITEPEILRFAWEFVDTLKITTADRVGNDLPVVVSYHFDGLNGIDEVISTDIAANLSNARISLESMVEIEPALVRKSALSRAHPYEGDLFEKFMTKAASQGI